MQEKGLVSARCMKKIGLFFILTQDENTLRQWITQEMEILSEFHLPHYWSSSAVVNQCLWIWCPPERISGNIGVMTCTPRWGAADLLTSWHFSGQNISSPFFLSRLFLLSVLSPHPFLSLHLSCCLCGPKFHIVLTLHIGVLTLSTRIFCWICFLEFNTLNWLTNEFTCTSYDAEACIWKEGWEGGIWIMPLSSSE